MSALKNHPYHVLPLSPWPVVVSLGMVVTIIGGILAARDVTLVPFLLGLVIVLGGIFGWFRDIIHEAQVDKDHTPAVQQGLRVGMILFIISEVAFFAAFFWGFFDMSFFPREATGGTWPPKGIEIIAPFHLPYLNTLILLLSGTTITWAHQALMDKSRQDLIKGLSLTVGLGVIFLIVQGLEYAHAPFAMGNSIYGSLFFMTTGFHGFHVLMGTIMLLVCFLRARQGHFTPDHHVGFEASAWYWHFVDVVWLFLFVWVYWWGSQ